MYTSSIFDSALNEACGLSLEAEHLRLESSEPEAAERSLTPEETALLAERILALPLDYRNLILGRFCFGRSPQELGRMFAIENPKGKLRYAHRLLSCFLAPGDRLIDEPSLLEAAELALRAYTDYDDTDAVKPRYSRAFRKKMKAIAATGQKKPRILRSAAARAAAIVLALAIGVSSMILVVSAEAREAFLNWLVDTFPQFSIFHSLAEEDEINLSDLIIKYIPEGFFLTKKHETPAAIFYQYNNLQDRRLIIKFSTDIPIYLNTENAVTVRTPVKNLVALYWEYDSYARLVWENNGISFDISGNISLEEMLKVAESIE